MYTDVRQASDALKAISLADNDSDGTMCPSATNIDLNPLGERLNGINERRSTAKELRYSFNRCLLNIGDGITNIGD